MILIGRVRSAAVAATLTLVVTLSSASRAEDFLIVERSANLHIFNRYQQRLTSEERQNLLPFTPFRIISAADVLGDGFTPCLRVEADGNLYFIQKDERGELLGASRAGFIRKVAGATMHRDSIEVLDPAGLPMLDPRRQGRVSVARGGVLVRIFSVAGLTYAYSPFFRQYGWVNLEPTGAGRRWRVHTREPVSIAQPVMRVVPAIRQRVEEVNAKLRGLFEHLNAKGPRHLDPPQWQVRISAGSVICTLVTSLPPQRFAESSALLARRIEGALLGTDLRVQASPGNIQVR